MAAFILSSVWFRHNRHHLPEHDFQNHSWAIAERYMGESRNSEISLSYSDSGVSIDAGNEFVERIKPAVRETFRPGVLQGLGGFGALFELPLDDYKSPVLVSGTDGVGTKLKLASSLNRHDTIGIDLVAMCVNDIVVCGAEPLFFLDYFATGKLDLDQAELVVRGIARGCSLAGCALTGGETAEMPGMYQPGDYDLAGFAVGIVEKENIITPDRVKVGNVILGLGSSGPHSNGYSLIRKVIEVSGADLSRQFEESTLGEKLTEPTRIYVKSILSLLQVCEVTAISHITGGGFTENLPRVLPHSLNARISRSSWVVPGVFSWLQDAGNITDAEMMRTFNCGIGMAVCVDESDADAAAQSLRDSGEQVVVLGEIIDHGDTRVEFTD